MPYIQKVGKMNEKQENSTLMENNRRNKKCRRESDMLNSFVNAGREQILQKSKPLQSDHFLDVLKEVQIDEGNYAPSG